MKVIATKNFVAINPFSCSAICPRCNGSHETITHAPWDCPNIQEIWRLGGYLDLIPRMASDIREIMLFMMDKDLTNLLEFFWIVAWYVWWHQNKYIHGDTMESEHDVFCQIKRLHDETKQLLPPPRVPVESTQVLWQGPEAGIVKINTDGATFDQDRGTGIGVVIRDSGGQFLAGLSRRNRGDFSAEVIEALAIQEGCLLAKEMGLCHIVIESDAQNVVLTVQSKKYEGPNVGNIIYSIVGLLSSFSMGHIIYCPRDSNKVAHMLAQHARDIDGRRVWRNNGPALIQHQLRREGMHARG